MIIHYLIIDDEPIAHQIIENYCRALPLMRCAGRCFNAFEAQDLLKTKVVDLLFLDIQMPELSGFAFLRQLENPPLVVVISAFQEYALEGFELDVCDYLLKPFSQERFGQAIIKAQLRLEARQVGTESDQVLHFKDGRKRYQVRLDQILFVEALGNYCMIHSSNGQIMIREKLSELEKRLSDALVRVHKSYLVSWRKIDLIDGDRVHIGTHKLPVGRVYKAGLNNLVK